MWTPILEEEVMRIAKRILPFLLMFSAIAYAKTKTSVKVRVEEDITNLNNAHDSSSMVGSSATYTSYLNVTVLPDNPTDTLMNDGKWCIKSMPGQTVHLAKGGTYAAVLDGSFVNLEIPQPKGKPLNVDFMVYDHRWRTKLDIH
jgi:hypothetical protein